jgi:hypothetical protein
MPRATANNSLVGLTACNLGARRAIGGIGYVVTAPAIIYPLADIAVHMEQPKWIRWEGVNGRRVVPFVLAKLDGTVVAEVCVMMGIFTFSIPPIGKSPAVLSLWASTRRVFPLRL